MQTKKISKILVSAITFIIINVILAMQFNAVSAAENQKVEEKHLNIEDTYLFYKTKNTKYIDSLPGENVTPEQFIAKVVFYILIVANILAFISFVAAGIFMLISQGNEEDIKKAKEIFLYTVMAMIICAIALAVVYGITSFSFF
jgi:hypothetical protein